MNKETKGNERKRKETKGLGNERKRKETKGNERKRKMKKNCYFTYLTHYS